MKLPRFGKNKNKGGEIPLQTKGDMKMKRCFLACYKDGMHVGFVNADKVGLITTVYIEEIRKWHVAASVYLYETEAVAISIGYETYDEAEKKLYDLIKIMEGNENE
jgi:hypothetical protein